MAQSLTVHEQKEKVEAELKEEKKKVSLLRKALKQEREEKLKQLQEAADKLNILECQIAEKNAKIEMLKFEKEDLAHEVKLVSEVKEGDSPASPNGRPGRALEILEQQNKKLLEQVHSLLNDNARLHEKIQLLSKDKEMTDVQVNGRVSILQTQVEELEAHLASLTEEHEKLLQEHQELRSNSLSQHEQKTELEMKVSELKTHLDATLSQFASLQETIEEKELVISTLSQRLLKVSEANADLANKMMELKNDLIDAQVNYQCFDVIKCGRLLNSSAKLTIKRNFNGEPVVEWEVRGHKYIFKADAVDNVYMHPTREDRFCISILSEREKEFMSDQAQFIVKKLRDFLMRANISKV
mmetsp:Transcript_11131/g.21878  ORF Transcript_11131/g.21878 Transcript_11131/m.21878 type:complete len:355 (-) Transcript_11131:4249-5313(-)